MFAFIRTLLITDPLIVLATFLMGSASLLMVPFDRHGDLQQACARIWAKMLLKIMGIRVTVEGLEKIDPRRNYIFICNHLSYTDTPVILGSIRSRFRFMAKKGLFSIPFMGYHLRTAGHIPVNLDNPRESVRSMSAAGRSIRERKTSVLVFPEGGRTEGILEQFKEGAAYLAIKAGVPIVPMALVGTRNIMRMHGFVIRPGRVTLRVGEPISIDGLTTKDRERLTAELRCKVADLLGIQVDPYTQPKYA
jgi:1-acyl-sn-glycerol-3-phosphate acyltransferase